MIITVKKKKIARWGFIMCVMSVYGALLLWTTHQVLLKVRAQPYAVAYDVTDARDVTRGNATCVRQLTSVERRWLRARYEPAIAPAWQEDGLELHYEVYDWWLSLQGGARVEVKRVFAELYEAGVPRRNPHPPVDGGVEQACRRCAVVGNSPRLLGAGHGQAIDAHDHVIRVGGATTQGYTQDVGHKTTHHFVTPETSPDTFPTGTSMVLVPFKPYDLQWLLSALTTGSVRNTFQPVINHVTCDHPSVTVVNPLFIKYVHDRWTQRRGRYPSLELLAVVSALHDCDQVAGFGLDLDATSRRDNYWDPDRHQVEGEPRAGMEAGHRVKGKPPVGMHDVRIENGLLRQLEAKRVVDFV